MKQNAINFLNSNAGRAIAVLFFLTMLWCWREYMHSQAVAEWIGRGHGTFGQVFDMGLMVGGLFGIAFWLCLPARSARIPWLP